MPSRSRLQVVLLSGRIGSGKTRLATQLVEKYEASLIKTRELILQELPRTKDQRLALQRAGERLDRDSQGRWVGNALVRKIEEIGGPAGLPSGLYVLDGARIPGQIEAIRAAFDSSVVHHVHLTASDVTLASRFNARSGTADEGVTWEEAAANQTERRVENLAELADTVVNTDYCTPDAVLVRATALLGLYPRGVEALVDVLVGGQYGSEGKGNIVGHIAPEYDVFVRVGGPNAGHKVYAQPEPEAYFHLPSGSERAPNAKLLLGPGAVIYPPKLLEEITRHKVAVDRLVIDGQAMIIEPADQESEKLKLASMGSTTQGVGAASARKIMGRGGKEDPPVRLARDVPELRPYVTSRDTTVAGCLADAGIAPRRVRRIVAVFRTYPIRVAGESGSLGAGELGYEELSRRSGIPVEELKINEVTTTTHRQRRLGEFDWAQLKRSCVLNGPTDIALTFVDYISIKNRSAFRFEQLTVETLRFIEEVERVAGQPVTMISTKFDWRNVIDRRSW